MSCEVFFTGDYNEEWKEGLFIDLYQEYAVIQEKLYYIESPDEEIVGRTMTVGNTVGFLRALGVKNERHFKELLDEKCEAGKPSFDGMIRLCENNRLQYTVEGYRLRHAYILYQKEYDEYKHGLWKEAAEQCRKATRSMRLSSSKTPLDMPEAYRLLSDAAYIKDFPPAFGLLAIYYMNEHDWGKAVRTAIAGAEHGNARSMYALARLYDMGADFDKFTNEIGERNFPKAAEWCRKAIEKGSLEAIKMMKRLISEGHVEASSDEIVKLLATEAHLHTNIFGHINKHNKDTKNNNGDE